MESQQLQKVTLEAHPLSVENIQKGCNMYHKLQRKACNSFFREIK
jgi:hypothetical protein